MATISATHWTPSEAGGFEARETRTFGTTQAARLWAASVVPVTVTTTGCYWRDCARAGHVEFTRVAPKGNRSHGRFWRSRMSPAGRYDAPVSIVPSVGELGYW